MEQQQAAHAPRPWSICYDGQIDAADGSFVCSFRWDSFKEFNDSMRLKADARLIAAAPDLLAAAIEFMHGEGNCKAAREMFRAAIAKATAA